MELRVLVADDSLFIREMIRHYLERMGLRVVAEAANAAQTLTLFKTLKPDFVVLDVIMPQVDGIDSLAAFRTIRSEAPEVPILIVTAIPFEQTREVFMKEGALGYVLKPLNKHSFDEVGRKLSVIYASADASLAANQLECHDRRTQ